MIRVLSRAFTTGMQRWRIALIVYVIQLCLALPIGMEVRNVLVASIGNSLEFNKLLGHYDHTVFSDFLKVHGASITPLIGQLRWLFLVWVLFSVFTDAGLLNGVTTSGPIRGRVFWEGGACYFFPFLKIGLILLVLWLVWTVVIFLPVVLLVLPALENSVTEIGPVWTFLGLLGLYVAGLLFIQVWSVVSRLQHIRTSASVRISLQTGLRILNRHKSKLMLFMLAFFAVQVLLFAIYWWLESHSGMITPILIVIFFAIQQAFAFFRIQLRQMAYAGIALMTE